MKYLRQEISDLLTSTVEDEFSEWDSTGATTYNTESEPLSDVSVVRYGNYYYRTLIDNNSSLLPPNDESQLDKTWFKWGASNKYALIDLRAKTKSTIDSTPLYTTDGTSQVVSILIEDLVFYEVAGGGGVVGSYYEAKTIQASVDLNTEDFANATNWKIHEPDLVVTFEKGFKDTLAIGYYSAETLKIEILDDVDTVLYTLEETQSVNDTVFDYFDYFYDAYSLDVDRNKLFVIPHIGTKVRVSFIKGAFDVVDVGFMIAGEAVEMGDTKYGVNFSFNSYSKKITDEFGTVEIEKSAIQDLVDFETTIDSNLITTHKREVKKIYDEVVAFILDPTENSEYENLITLGTIENFSTILSNPTKTVMSYSVSEVV